MAKRLLLALLAATMLVCAWQAQPANARPTVARYLRPGQHVVFAHGRRGWDCKHRRRFRKVAAYLNGRALRERHDSRYRTDYWLVPHRGTHTSEVVWDGIAFFNHSRRGVLAAGWC